MANTHLIVVGVMGRSNFYSAGTKFQINVAICDNRNNATIGRQGQMLTNQMTITGVSRVNSYSSIARDGLRTGSSDSQVGALFLHYRITEIPQMSRVILMLNLDIRKSGVTVYAPVGNTGTLINQALFEQGAEHLAYSLGAALIHSKALALPITGNAQMLQLVDNTIAVLLLPSPNALQEFLTAQIITSLTLFFFNNLFYLNLGSKTCMVITRHPQGVMSHHTMPTNQNIL